MKGFEEGEQDSMYVKKGSTGLVLTDSCVMGNLWQARAGFDKHWTQQQGKALPRLCWPSGPVGTQMNVILSCQAFLHILMWMIARSACLYDVICYTRSFLHLCIREDCDRMLVYVLCLSFFISKWTQRWRVYRVYIQLECLGKGCCVVCFVGRCYIITWYMWAEFVIDLDDSSIRSLFKSSFLLQKSLCAMLYCVCLTDILSQGSKCVGEHRCKAQWT